MNGNLWNAPLLQVAGFADIHASDGDQFATLQANDQLGSIGQTFDTDSGQTYRVEFDLSALTESISNPSQTFTLTAVAPGLSRDFSFTAAGLTFAKGVGTDPWAHYGFDFVADGSSSTLMFVNRTFKDVGAFGTSLDNVTVRPLTVPEPTAMIPIALEGAWPLLSRPWRRRMRCTL